MPRPSEKDAVTSQVRAIKPPVSLPALRSALAGHPHAALLESIDQRAPAGAYSIYALDPVATLSIPALSDIDPFAALAAHCRPWSVLGSSDVPFVGGWIGYFSYDAGRFIEPSAGWSSRHSVLPIAHWSLYDTVLVHNIARDQWFVAGVELPVRLRPASRPSLDARLQTLEDLVEGISSSCDAVQSPAAQAQGRTCVTFPSLTSSQQTCRLTAFDDTWVPLLSSSANTRQSSAANKSNSSRWDDADTTYLDNVRRALAYIRAGDIFQVNLARRMRVPTTEHSLEIYDRLCKTNPAAYAAYLSISAENASDANTPSEQPRRPAHSAILSSSPELFLSLTGRDVITRPIKGTRPRTGDTVLDTRAVDALIHSEKDAAELNMIIDLERNDLGRVCDFGSVYVLQAGEIESHPTVFHRAATIKGRLRDDLDAIDLLRATFPGGSITGTPKVRAMQIINELEPFARGPYCGTIGYITLDGNMQLNLAIRTMTITNGEAAVLVGSGIVADSDPEDEAAEINAKAAGLLAALNLPNAQQQIPAESMTA